MIRRISLPIFAAHTRSQGFGSRLRNRMLSTLKLTSSSRWRNCLVNQTERRERLSLRANSSRHIHLRLWHAQRQPPVTMPELPYRPNPTKERREFRSGEMQQLTQGLLQTGEIESLSEHHPGGFVEYVYFYSLAILCILITLSIWGLAGLKIFDAVWPTSSHAKTYFGIKLILFTLSSLTLRECWHIVLAAQWMLLTRREIIKGRSKSEP